MSTSATNNIRREVRLGSICEDASSLVDSTVSFNQGDLLAIVSNKLKAIAIDGDTTTFAGVARMTVVLGKPVSPYQGTAVDASVAASAVVGPCFGVDAALTLNTGDAFHPGDLVYPIGSVNAQTVSSSSNTGARKPCGLYVGPTVASAAAGQLGIVSVGVAFPDGNLKF